MNSDSSPAERQLRRFLLGRVSQELKAWADESPSRIDTNSVPTSLSAWLRFLVFLVAATIAASGCDRIKSILRTHPKEHPSSKERVGNHPPYAPGEARLAIILDDFGNDLSAANAALALPYPVTVSILPHHPYSTQIAEEAHRRGHQVMLHLPMQPQGNEPHEAQELRTGMSSTQIRQVLGDMLQDVPNVAGVNNHQGSLATADPALMNELMPMLRDRHLFFVDSRTTAATVAFDTAQRDGLRCAFRDVPFLDDVEDIPAIHKQLELAIRGAKENGEAIAIGHPHPETLRALNELLPEAQAQGVRLVYASELVH